MTALPDGTVPPGEYHPLVRMLNRPAEGVRGEFVGVSRASPLDVATDRPAELDPNHVGYGWEDDGYFVVRADMTRDTDVYLVPTEKIRA